MLIHFHPAIRIDHGAERCAATLASGDGVVLHSSISRRRAFLVLLRRHRKLNEITVMVSDKNSIQNNEEVEIKNIFKNILKNGETYDVDEIESWFTNEGTWKNKKSITRITNISHYIQTKHEQTNKFKILSNNDSCSCES